MKLIKIFIVNFHSQLEDDFNFDKIIGDTRIKFQDKIQTKLGAEYCFSAEKNDVPYELADTLIRINNQIFEELTISIEDVINLISLSKNIGREITSANPSFFLQHENEIDLQNLKFADKIEFNSHELAYYSPVHKFDFDYCFTNLSDRLDGVRIFAEALSAKTFADKYRELFRLFEIAFNKENRGLVIPMTNFLEHNKFLNYTQNEIESWIKIRHKIIHANHKEGFLINRNLYSIMARVEQAGIDILFNKHLWNQNSILRRNLYKFTIGVNKKNQVFSPPNFTFSQSIIAFDETKTFPTNYFAGFNPDMIPNTLWHKKKN